MMVSKETVLLPGGIKLIFAALFLAAVGVVRADVVPSGSLMSAQIRYEFAIYYLTPPSESPLASLKSKIVGSKSAGFKLVGRLPKSLDGRLLSLEQARALQDSKQALIMDFGYPQGDVWGGLRAAYGIAEAVARDTGGLLWDEQTREVFSPDEWHKRRLATWDGTEPEISRHVVIHAYNSGEYVSPNFFTLGMEKFGLPDVVVNGTSWSMNREVGNLINAFCQSMAEGTPVGKGGAFRLDLHAIRNKSVHDIFNLF